MVGGQFWSVYMDCGRQGADAVRATLEQIDVVYNFARKFPNTFQIVVIFFINVLVDILGHNRRRD